MIAKNTEIYQTLVSLPKADLHIHFEGCTTHAVLESLSKKQNRSLYSPIQIGKKELKIPENFNFTSTNFTDFRNFALRYMKTTELIRETEDIISIGTAHLEHAKCDNIVATQFYFTPSTFKLLDIDLEPLFLGLRELENVARLDYSCQISWIFDIARNSSRPPQDTLDFALNAKRLGVSVTAIGLAGDERCHTASFYAPTFEKARALGFEVLAHAGEGTSSNAIMETIKAINPSRIGHGISSISDATCIKQLKDTHTTIEVCPWSNICMGITTPTSHPIRDMIDLGLDLVIASDDPGIFGKSLIDNYIFAYEAGVSLNQLTKIAKRSVELSQSFHSCARIE